MAGSMLTRSEEEYLHKIGLSKHAVRLYDLLLKHSLLTARQAANLSGEFVAAEYRLFTQLEAFGLARRGSGRPAVFTALPKQAGLRAAYLHSRNVLDKLVSGLNIGPAAATQEIIVGRQAMYDRYIELAAQSAQEICIYAIGIAYSKGLLQAQKTAMERGIKIRHVLQQIKPSNFHVAHSWQRLGVNVRYEPSGRGFHLMLFDGKQAMITFSDPKNTDDRLSILTENPAAVKMFSTHFEDIWRQAKKVSL